MTVFAEGQSDRDSRDVQSDIRKRVAKLAEGLASETSDSSVSLVVGGHWREALSKKVDQDATADESNLDSDTQEGKGKGVDARTIVAAATWEVLLEGSKHELSQSEEHADANTPAAWLHHRLARVTGGPVSIPPLTSAVIEHWSATTQPPNAFLPVHPFLYGLLPDEEGTPLIGIAFRLEMDGLMPKTFESEDDEDDEFAIHAAQVEQIFRRFPPRRTELHFIPITTARNWLSSEQTAEIPVAHFDGDEWSVVQDRDDVLQIRPGSILVLPTLCGSQECLKDLLDDSSEIASRDVLDGVATKRPAYWRRVVQVEKGEYRLNSQDGASRLEERAESEDECAFLGDPAPDSTWVPRLRCRLRIRDSIFRFEYLKPKRPIQQQFLDDLDGCPGHLSRAHREAARVAAAVAPGNNFLWSVVVEAAKVHDEGKRNCKWQRAMGNPECSRPVAKPTVERPASMGGFRHEWESLVRTREYSPAVPDGLSPSDRELWIDIWRHLVASHHGYLRPWISDSGFTLEIRKQQQRMLRLEAAERFVRLQRLLGPWRLAYLEALIKAADVASSQPETEEDLDEQ